MSEERRAEIRSGILKAAGSFTTLGTDAASWPLDELVADIAGRDLERVSQTDIDFRVADRRARLKWVQDFDICHHYYRTDCSCIDGPFSYAKLFVDGVGCAVCTRGFKEAPPRPTTSCAHCQSDLVEDHHQPACDFCGDASPFNLWRAIDRACDRCGLTFCFQCSIYTIANEQTDLSVRRLLDTKLGEMGTIRKNPAGRVRGISREILAALTVADVLDDRHWKAGMARMPKKSFVIDAQAEVREQFYASFRVQLEHQDKKPLHACCGCREAIAASNAGVEKSWEKYTLTASARG